MYRAISTWFKVSKKCTISKNHEKGNSETSLTPTTTVATLRKHFSQWTKTSLKEERGVTKDNRTYTGSYRFFIMVDQEVMDSVSSAPEDKDEAGFVRVVYTE
jgi:hypothetical protein